MPKPFTSPVEDSVPKVDEKIAVGENLEFQRKWWRFERVIWSVFLVILVCDVLGLFGRGWLSKAKLVSDDGELTLNYERMERSDTPSIMTLHFSEQAIHDGRVKIFVGRTILGPLGAQRISPQPVVSAIGEGGITYTFAATEAPAVVQIALKPSFPGPHKFTMRMEDGRPVEGSVFVFP
ncbi:MAG: hypothetical protein HIU91_00205 [Acidobacteria bacterium]|nr:hypothetical protein [Acidobacteriota bacterium]